MKIIQKILKNSEQSVTLQLQTEKKKERKNNRHRRLGTGGKSIGNAGELPSI